MQSNARLAHGGNLGGRRKRGMSDHNLSLRDLPMAAFRTSQGRQLLGCHAVPFAEPVRESRGHRARVPQAEPRGTRGFARSPVELKGSHPPRSRYVPTAAAGCKSSRTRRHRMVGDLYDLDRGAGLGKRPRAWKARPPTVRKSPSVGRWRPSRSFSVLERRAWRRPRTASPPSGTHRVGGGRDVVLVVDRADELLEQVFERDQAGDAAVLVEHDGDLASASSGTRRAARRRSWSRGRSRPGRTSLRGDDGVGVARRRSSGGRGPWRRGCRRCRRGSRRRAGCGSGPSRGRSRRPPRAETDGGQRDDRRARAS